MKELLEKWVALEPLRCQPSAGTFDPPGTFQLVTFGQPVHTFEGEVCEWQQACLQAAVQDAITARETWAFHVDNIFRPRSGDSPCVMGFSAGVWVTEDGILVDNPPYFEAGASTSAEALLRAYLMALEAQA